MMHIGPELPGLPGIPSEIGPVPCPDCDTRQAVVHHIPAADGDYTPTLVCGDCGACHELEPNAYVIGLAAGVLYEHQKWHESDGSQCAAEAEQVRA
jgi:hypothetical protein